MKRKMNHNVEILHSQKREKYLTSECYSSFQSNAESMGLLFWGLDALSVYIYLNGLLILRY